MASASAAAQKSKRKSAKTEQQKSPNQKTDKHSKHCNEQVICVTCNSVVGEKEKSMPCDFCEGYTHLICDGKYSDKLYNLVTEHEDNPLIYLCLNCKPMILPTKSAGMWKGFLQRVEKLIAGKSSPEPLATKIMDRLSEKIVELDKLCKSNSELLHNTIKEIHALSEVISDAKSTPRQHMQNPRSYSERTQLPYHQPPPPPLMRPSSLMIPPIIPPSHPGHNSAQQNRLNSSPQENVIDPTTTFVVYNSNKDDPPYITVERLMLRCGIYKYEVLDGNRIGKGQNGKSPPIYITCDRPGTKWKFMKDINLLKAEPEFENMYARPFMTVDDLKKDRDLVRKLKDVRNRYDGRIFKIYKGEVHEQTEDSFVKFLEPTNHEDAISQASETPPLEESDEQSVRVTTPESNNKQQNE